MKKFIICLLSLLLLLTGCSRKTYQEIDLNTLESKINNKETFVLYIGSSTCSNCASLEPTLNKVIENYNITVYYINVHNLSDDDNDELLGMIDYGNKTPAIYFITNGEHDDINVIKGNQAYETLVKYFKQYGYIKEE
jgi:predicted bacteriocin transport accessory protein